MNEFPELRSYDDSTSIAKGCLSSASPASGPSQLNQEKLSHAEKVKLNADNYEDIKLEPNKDSQWKTVKKQRRPFIGKKIFIDNAFNIKAVTKSIKPIKIFLSRLDPETTEDDLQQDSSSQFKAASHITCEKLSTKFPSYSSFRIILTSISYSDGLNVENWLLGIPVKKFCSPKPAAVDTANATKQTNFLVVS